VAQLDEAHPPLGDEQRPFLPALDGADLAVPHRLQGEGGHRLDAAAVQLAQAATELLDGALAIIGQGGLNSVLDKFRQYGLGDAVQSWIGTGSNLPVSGEHVEASLGEDKISEIAERTGLPHAEVAHGLAQLLPALVDKLTPDGKLPDNQTLSTMLALFKSNSAGSVQH
jgi:uncharacterized protein YidB (DUF937 family)